MATNYVGKTAYKIDFNGHNYKIVSFEVKSQFLRWKRDPKSLMVSDGDKSYYVDLCFFSKEEAENHMNDAISEREKRLEEARKEAIKRASKIEDAVVPSRIEDIREEVHYWGEDNWS